MQDNGVFEQDSPAAEVMNSRIIEVVGRDIVTGVLAPGKRLTLVGLQEQFGVSRTVVRDCMQILEAMNLVYSKRRIGIVVLEPERWNVYDPRIIRWRLAGPGRSSQFRSLTELRIAVEPLAAAGAARAASEEQRRSLQDLAERMRRDAHDPEAFLAADIAFHTLLLQASGNEMFASLREVFAEVLSGRSRQNLMPAGPRPEALDLHAGVADAVGREDPAAARAQMAELLVEVEEAIRLHG
ncbi:FadR/GntR family transcriptional regulator [Arthrobacter sp. Helios]|uniref:FadR/GntR family transcriptional regulator n=1 Tax=Arthrobacter sp. Helios TaxID=2828862 RepID=UPI00206235DC|nr:FadR/GntR family transcriptional regulator [Arthrobacter sp. Helios]UPO76637.1 FadR family transcriptional regulator [Arthrobacter sp. Helios]